MSEEYLPSSPLDREADDRALESRSRKFTSIDPKFVLDCASGLEEIEEIAPRYGFSPEDVARLKEYKPFMMAVEQMKADLYRSGKTFKLKAGVMAEEVMERVFRDAISPDIGPANRLEALKTLSRLADLEPKNAAASGANGQVQGFSVVINVGSPDAKVEIANG